MKFAVDDKLRKLILHIFLNGAFERTRPELRIISSLGDEVLSLVGDGKRVTQLSYPSVESTKLYVDDPENRLLGELIEHHDVVNTVEKLGRKRLVKRLAEHAVAVLAVDGLSGEAHS